jgi:hypothetical protein
LNCTKKIFTDLPFLPNIIGEIQTKDEMGGKSGTHKEEKHVQEFGGEI